MKTKRFAFFSGRFGFFVLVLLAVAVVGAQAGPPPQPGIAAATNIRLQVAAERLQELDALARSLEMQRLPAVDVEVTIGATKADGKE